MRFSLSINTIIDFANSYSIYSPHPPLLQAKSMRLHNQTYPHPFQNLKNTPPLPRRIIIATWSSCPPCAYIIKEVTVVFCVGRLVCVVVCVCGGDTNNEIPGQSITTLFARNMFPFWPK